MSTLSTVRRGLVVTAAAAVAGPLAAAAASAATTGTDTGVRTDAGQPQYASAVANGVSQFADTVPIARSNPGSAALTPLTGPVNGPLAGPLSGQLPPQLSTVLGPAAAMTAPLLGGFSSLPMVGTLTDGLTATGIATAATAAHSANTVPATRSAMPDLGRMAAPAAAPQSAAPSTGGSPVSSLGSSLPMVNNFPGASGLSSLGALGSLGGVPSLTSLPGLGSVTGLLHF